MREMENAFARLVALVEVLHLSEECGAIRQDDAVVGDLEPAMRGPRWAGVLLLDQLDPAEAHHQRREQRFGPEAAQERRVRDCVRQRLAETGDELALRARVLQRAALIGEVPREELQQVEAQRITRDGLDVVVSTFHGGSILWWSEDRGDYIFATSDMVHGTR